MAPGKNAYASDDISSYSDIYHAVTDLHRICTVSYEVPGWLSVGTWESTMQHPSLPSTCNVQQADHECLGDTSSTGVFLYASNSTLDKALNATEPDTRISDHMPDGWSYLGCNYDTTNKALKNVSWSGDNLSVERCGAFCQGYRYFGVERGNEWVSYPPVFALLVLMGLGSDATVVLTCILTPPLVAKKPVT